jgi:SAM-dependent methyltransferase
MAEWFEDWFDTDYYHILYANRDLQEAEQFICKLVDSLDLPKGAKVVDLACGKGRHSKTLNDLGFNVVGLDLSPNSIKAAEEFSNESCVFQVHDMREPFKEKGFDAVFNLFTSFGYFDSIEDNRKVLRSITTYVNANGRLVIDFLNAYKVIANLVSNEEKSIKGLSFKINRSFDDNYIRKKIHVIDGDKEHFFEERVQALMLPEMKGLLNEEGYVIEEVYGNYELDSFDPENSDRLIIIAKLK